MYEATGPHVGRLPELANPYEGDGWDWMGSLGNDWAEVPSWGSQGWDLGCWPLIIVAVCRIDTSDLGPLWGVCTYVEGDLTVESFTSQEALFEAVDKIAEFYWRHHGTGPRDLPEGGGLLDHHKGPYRG